MRKQTEEEAKRAFSHGSSSAGADMATEGVRKPQEGDAEVPHAKPVEPLAKDEKPDHWAEREAKSEDRQEALLDEAIEETFPGSDPISPKHIT